MAVRALSMQLAEKSFTKVVANVDELQQVCPD